MYANKGKAKPITLTPDQRARKRAADRKFRKSSREKTKSYIAHLEKLVEASSAPSNDPEKVQRLMQEADENYNDALQLRSALTNIIELAQSNLQRLSERAHKSPLAAMPDLASSEGFGDQEDFRSRAENSDNGAMGTVELRVDVDQFTGNSYSRDLEELLEAVEPFQRQGDGFASVISVPHNPDQMEPRIANTQDPCLLISDMTIPEESYCSYKPALAKTFEPTAPAILQPSTTNNSQSIWNSLGTITYTALGSSKKSDPFLWGQLQKAQDENVLITAVVHGWHSVPEQYLFDPTWQAIRRIDEQMLRPYRAVEKLAMLYVSALQLSVG